MLAATLAAADSFHRAVLDGRIFCSKAMTAFMPTKSGAIPVTVGSICLVLALLAIKRLVFAPDPRFLLAALTLSVLASIIYAISVMVLRPGWPSRNELFIHALNLTLLFSSCTAVVHVLKLTAQRWPSTPAEEAIYMSVVRFPHMADIYSMENLTRPPVYVSIYSPAYYGIYRVLVWCAGQTLVLGRWLSAVGLFTTACLLALALRRKGDELFRLIPPLLFLSVFPTLCWTGSFAKPEFLAVPFSLAGILVYIEFNRRGGKRWILGAALLSSLALLIKPTVLAGTAAIAIHLLWTKRFNRFLEFALTIGVIVSLIYAFFSWHTAGGFWVMTIIGNNARFIPKKILEFAFDVFLPNPIVLVSIAATVILFADASRDNQRPSVWTVFFVVAFGWFFFTVGRPGSSYTYFLEAAVACSIVMALLLSQVAVLKDPGFFHFACICLILALTVNLRGVASKTRWSYDDKGDRAQIVRLLSGLKTTPTDFVLSDPHYAFLASTAGHNILVNDSLIYTLMVDNGVVSDKPILNALKNNRVPYLVLAFDLQHHAELGYGAHFWPQDVVEYLKQHYACDSVFKRGFGPPLWICHRAEGPIGANAGSQVLASE